MLLHDSFCKSQYTKKPHISDFALVVPDDIGQQLPDLNDCGIWVAKWMMERGWSEDYKIKVDNETRMKLALELVLSSHNTQKNEVIKLAAGNWKNLEEKKKRISVS
ncbi:Ulp1 protease family, carboxy-terminal domain protein [Spatholobus suberectus]|nr:Ulp1 protease family, carboxy-terminal domain protein [Spatholobus suberectus]